MVLVKTETHLFSTRDLTTSFLQPNLLPMIENLFLLITTQVCQHIIVVLSNAMTFIIYCLLLMCQTSILLTGIQANLYEHKGQLRQANALYVWLSHKGNVHVCDNLD